jgi:hypothetical protein
LLSESQVLLEARQSTIEEQVLIRTSLLLRGSFLLTANLLGTRRYGFFTPSEKIL